MEDNEKLMDQAAVAESVSNKIKYEFSDYFLVKPLDPIKVKKEFTKLPEDKKPVKDKNGVEAVNVEDSEIKTEVKEVDSDYRKAVVLKTPFYYEKTLMENPNMMKIKVGDIILYKENRSMWFDLIKDSQLVKIYEIIAVENN